MNSLATIQQVADMFDITTTRVQQFRDGYKVGNKYSYPPILKERKDYIWKRGICLFTTHAVEVIKTYYKQ
jgi:hypothetical protein